MNCHRPANDVRGPEYTKLCARATSLFRYCSRVREERSARAALRSAAAWRYSRPRSRSSGWLRERRPWPSTCRRSAPSRFQLSLRRSIQRFEIMAAAEQRGFADQLNIDTPEQVELEFAVA